METLSREKDTFMALEMLLISKGVETHRHPYIVDVEAVAPEVATRMRVLGYDKLSEDLLKAFVREGLVTRPEPGEQAFLGPQAMHLVGGTP